MRATKHCLIKCKLTLSFLFMLKVKINFRLKMAKSQFPSFPRSWIIYVLGIFIIHSKYFPNSDLQKKTRIIHHHQLPMTKSGRILCLTRKWRQKCSPQRVNAPLTEKTWGRSWVVFVQKTKTADTSLVSRVRTTAGTMRNNC